MSAFPLANFYKRSFLIVLCSGLIGCGGTKVLEEPVPISLGPPLAASTNDQLTVSLDWVIVRDGPGSWARNADWDEYLIRFENRYPAAVSIRDIAVYDSTLTRQQSMGERKALVAASRRTARRYAGQGVEVKAGMGGGALIAAGVVGGIVYLLPGLGWEYQVLIFSVLSVISIIVWRKFFRTQPADTDQPALNRRGEQYIGRLFTLNEPIIDGMGKIRVDDSTWKIRGDDCKVGTQVEVTGVDGTILEVKCKD